jgi:spore coat protein U-like protein
MKRGLVVLVAGLCVGLSSGAAAKECKLSFNSSPSGAALSLDTPAFRHIQVGTVLEKCNERGGYFLLVESGHCPAAPAGAKLMDAATGEFVRYSVEFDNKGERGAISIVSGLLGRACTGQIARNESDPDGHASSDVFIDYTGATTLAAGTYDDTLSVTLNLK